jgi:hypothetical protein
MLLNPNCLSIFDSCISQEWITKIDLELYVLEIEESLKLFKVFQKINLYFDWSVRSFIRYENFLF